MENKIVKFDNSQKQAPEIRQHSHQKEKKSGSMKFNKKNKSTNFFSKGWNIIRFICFLAFMIFLLSVLFSAFSSIPEGDSFTWSFFFSQLRETLSIIGSNSPIGPLFEKITQVQSEGSLKLLFFISTLLFTISLLVCFCP